MEIKGMQLRLVDVDKLILDPHNPRFLHLALKGQTELTQEEMVEEIGKDHATITLSKAINKQGVLNPVVAQERDDGRFLVIDGNRRTVTVKLLHAEGAKAPAGKSFEEIEVYVIPRDTPAVDVEVRKGVLQEGQKSWGRFNDAAFVRRLRYEYKMELEDIADKLQLSVKKVKERLRDFDTYNVYTKTTGDTHPDRFSYFADAPPKVRKWFEESDENLNLYFELIAPGSDKHKIRSVATSGGLRDFAKILDDPDATKEFLENPKVTVEAALEIARENNLRLAAPFLKNIGKWAVQLATLDDAQIAMLRHEPHLKLDLRRLQEEAGNLLKRLDK